MSHKLTLEQIGKMAGVSRSTVSRVVNNHESVKPAVRERVLQVIAETGYHPNPAARSLAGQRSGIIGLVIPETAQILFTDPYFPRLIQGITQACNSNNYTLSLFLFHVAEDEAKLSQRIIQRQLFDGLVVTSTYIGDPLVNTLLVNQIPFVQVGQVENQNVSYVDSDNQAGAFAAVSHLVRLGHKRIATISGPTTNLAALQREQGYREALRSRGISLDERLIVTADFTQVGGYEAMIRLAKQKPDAVFVASDAMALGALRALRRLNLSVPEDVALVGYDDLPPATMAEPPLTTVRQPIRRAGVQAVETLLDILENGPAPTRRIILPTELVIRSSCGA